MTRKYRKSEQVPTEILIARVHELVAAIVNPLSALQSEFTMRVPVEFDRDADCVLSEVADRLVAAEALLRATVDTLRPAAISQSAWDSVVTDCTKYRLQADAAEARVKELEALLLPALAMISDEPCQGNPCSAHDVMADGRCITKHIRKALEGMRDE